MDYTQNYTTQTRLCCDVWSRMNWSRCGSGHSQFSDIIPESPLKKGSDYWVSRPNLKSGTSKYDTIQQWHPGYLYEGKLLYQNFVMMTEGKDFKHYTVLQQTEGKSLYHYQPACTMQHENNSIIFGSFLPLLLVYWSLAWTAECSKPTSFTHLVPCLLSVGRQYLLCTFRFIYKTFSFYLMNQ